MFNKRKFKMASNLLDGPQLYIDVMFTTVWHDGKNVIGFTK